MEKILTEDNYEIPFLRLVNLKLKEKGIEYDKSKPVNVRVLRPVGMESHVLTAKEAGNGPAVVVPKKLGLRFIHPINNVLLRVFQVVEDEKVIPKEEPEQTSLNPEPDPPEEKKGIIDKLLSGNIRPKDWKALAVKESEDRKTRLTKKREEVDQSTALKPIGLDGKKILTGDDCDYSRGMGVIEILKKLENIHNEQAGITSPSERKLLSEFYDVVSFSGIGVVIGLYIALGSKSKGRGSLDYLSNWYKNELSKIYSPTSFGEVTKKLKLVGNGLKPKALKRQPNPGLSIKQAEKIIGELFSDEFTKKPLRLSDIQCDIYQPIFFDNEETRVYSRGETQSARLVDVALNTGLDPLYFQSKKVERIGVPLGPTRRSFDLPFAQHNKGITLISVGSELTYQESEDKLEGLNPSQLAFLNKKKTYRLDYNDAKKYMEDHPDKVKYFRIESGHLYGVMANSILIKDLDACIESANRSKWWSNTSKPAINWS